MLMVNLVVPAFAHLLLTVAFTPTPTEGMIVFVGGGVCF